MLDEGIYATVSEIGDAEKISKCYLSRILRLALPAPDLVEKILGGRQGNHLDLAQLSKPFPVEWDRQRERFL